MFVVGDMAAKVTETVVAFSHVHDESAFTPKLKSALHGQVDAAELGVSVRESKVTITACPLSVNLAVRGCGAGVEEAEESNLTLIFLLEYSVELEPEKRRPTMWSPEVSGLDDKTKYPFSDDALVKSIDAGVATTSLLRDPFSAIKGVTLSVPQGTLGSSYEKTKVDLLALLYLVTSEYT